MRNLLEHLESHLGPIAAGWTADAEGQTLPFQVALFEHGPIASTSAITTLGLSHTPLALGDTGRRVRQELVLLFRQDFGYRNLPGVLQQVGLEALRKDKAYAAGDVIGPRGELVTGSQLQALYVAVPVYFPDSFHVYLPPNGEPVVFGWLVPITAKEAAFVRERGWAAFEEELARQDPDLLEFGRTSII